jgi:hypothetical protein
VWQFCIVRRLLVTANVVPISPNVTLKMEAIHSSKTPKRRCNIPVDGILHKIYSVVPQMNCVDQHIRIMRSFLTSCKKVHKDYEIPYFEYNKDNPLFRDSLLYAQYLTQPAAFTHRGRFPYSVTYIKNTEASG